MLKRLLTGTLIIAVVAGCIALRTVHLAFFDALVMLLMLVSMFEIIRAKKKAGVEIFEKVIIAFTIAVSMGFILIENLWVALMLELFAVLCVFIVSIGIELIIYGINRKTGMPAPENKDLFKKSKATVGVAIYPLVLISTMFIINHIGYNLGYIALITMFAITMTTDTFAYIFGMIFGRKQGAERLCPEVSPKKSVAGFIAGVVGGFVVSIICFVLFYHLGYFGNVIAHLSIAKALTMFTLTGIMGSFATQFGDLVASAVKRQADMKDFSKLLPGHGGIMDRIDGEIWCSAIVLAMFSLFLAL